MLESLTSLFTLTILEVVLSIDNLVVIAVLVGKLPKERQAAARYTGMTLALVPRLVLLFFIGWIIGLTEPLFTVFGHGVSGKDMILAAGGLFLIYKATQEIHASLEGEEGEASARVHVELYRRGGADRTDQHGLFDRQHRDRGRHGQRDLGDGGGGDPVDDRADGRLGAGGDLCRGASDGEGAGARLPDHDRHGAGRRRVRRARPEGLHLHGDDLLDLHRVHQHGGTAPEAGPVHLRNPYGEETDEPGDERRALEEAGMAAGRD